MKRRKQLLLLCYELCVYFSFTLFTYLCGYLFFSYATRLYSIQLNNLRKSSSSISDCIMKKATYANAYRRRARIANTKESSHRYSCAISCASTISLFQRRDMRKNVLAIRSDKRKESIEQNRGRKTS